MKPYAYLMFFCLMFICSCTSHLQRQKDLLKWNQLNEATCAATWKAPSCVKDCLKIKENCDKCKLNVTKASDAVLAAHQEEVNGNFTAITQGNANQQYELARKSCLYLY